MNRLFALGTRTLRQSGLRLPIAQLPALNRYYFASKTPEELQTRIFEYLQKHEKLSKKKVELKSKFAELGLDSLERVELIAEMEEHLDITLENELIDTIFTVTDAVSAFQKSQSKSN